MEKVGLLVGIVGIAAVDLVHPSAGLAFAAAVAAAMDFDLLQTVIMVEIVG